MNRTVTVNLSGSVLVLDEDAYQLLRDYLAYLDTHFAGEADRQEIIDDIEARMAEHFKSGLKVEHQVISSTEVNRVIDIMGRPGQLGDDGSTVSPKPSNRAYRRMYRDMDDRILGGVCSGMGCFFGIEPLLFRIVFVITLFGGGLGAIIYAIMWIVVPPAETTAQKLEMRGEPVTAENIGKNFETNK